ncbi:ABC transporter ATP-binding protein [Acetobacterium sp.]|uniref:ABC transporter ATP-binding protein n=1 Tax=Acetobacterium sp. TaxID=1872094 RepID=UPI002F406C45
MALIEYKNIDLKFNEQTLFSKFNLSIEENEKVLFLAPSGKGKTTLVKMLTGFIVPDAGEIIVKGIRLSGETMNTIRKNITYVSQDADIPGGIVNHVFEEVFSYQANRHLNFHKDVLVKWLSEFSLASDTLEKTVDCLSGGERQRLALIMGILLDREIWILDEITTGLDEELKQKIVDLILTYEKTILIVSHDDIYRNVGLREVVW